ncbi:MAG: hypothetical protein KDB90_18080, partial [Planctomycetes bacterium]|nr:hypothetical protein [Planctomycetota bacterium]
MSDQLTVGNIHAAWFVSLYYDGGTNSLTVGHQAGNLYGTSTPVYPFLANRPTIRRSINLKDCKAKISNVSIQLTNATYRGAQLWDELNPLSAARKYLNRAVVIQERLNRAGTLSTVFTGRIRELSLNRSSGKIDVILESNEPWDFISIPQTQLDTGQYFPVVYGDYGYSSSGSYCIYKQQFPVELLTKTSEELLAIMPFNTNTDPYRLHVYEESLDRFVPITDDSGNYQYTGTTDYDANGYVIPVYEGLIHSWKMKPLYLSTRNASTFTDPENAIDDKDADETTTYATCTINAGSGGGFELYFQVADSRFNPYDYSAAQVQIQVAVNVQVDSTSGTPILWLSIDGGSSAVKALTFVGTSQTTHTWTVGAADMEVRKLPTSMSLYFFRNSATGTPVTLKLFDVRVSVVAQTCIAPLATASDEQLADAKAIKSDVERLYCGGDGLTRAWSSGACDDVQEIHRDALIRFAGMTTSTPDGYSDLDTARSGFKGRLWLHKPVPLREVLERLQFEGQFIFTWAADGDPRYIFVKS